MRFRTKPRAGYKIEPDFEQNPRPTPDFRTKYPPIVPVLEQNPENYDGQRLQRLRSAHQLHDPARGCFGVVYLASALVAIALLYWLSRLLTH